MKHSTDTTYKDSPKRAFLFLSLLVLWGGLILFAILVLRGSPEEQYKSVYYSLEATKSFVTMLRQLFQYADDWNWITLSIILSFTVILYNINDIYLKRLFLRWTNKADPENFYYSGGWWFMRILTNSVLATLQIVIIAYLINISIGTQRIFTLDALKGTYDIVLLGTSKYLNETNNINQYYKQRIDATLELYRAGKVKSILISGDHQGEHYSEPIDMRKDLLKAGIPAKIITLDLEGYRTFDSIRKLKSKTSGNPLLFISQQFHLERALFIAKNSGIDAVGYAANGSMTVKMIKREAFAKTKVILDIYILNTQAFGMPAYPRRHISIFKATDLILLSFVLGIVVVAGRLSRNLLVF